MLAARRLVGRWSGVAHAGVERRMLVAPGPWAGFGVTGEAAAADVRTWEPLRIPSGRTGPVERQMFASSGAKEMRGSGGSPSTGRHRCSSGAAQPAGGAGPPRAPDVRSPRPWRGEGVRVPAHHRAGWGGRDRGDRLGGRPLAGPERQMFALGPPDGGWRPGSTARSGRCSHSEVPSGRGGAGPVERQMFAAPVGRHGRPGASALPGRQMLALALAVARSAQVPVSRSRRGSATPRRLALRFVATDGRRLATLARPPQRSNGTEAKGGAHRRHT